MLKNSHLVYLHLILTETCLSHWWEGLQPEFFLCCRKSLALQLRRFEPETGMDNNERLLFIAVIKVICMCCVTVNVYFFFSYACHLPM